MTFMKFWAAANTALRARHLPAMLYGEVRGAWEQYNGRG